MNMIGHNDEFIQFNAGIMVRQIQPTFSDNFRRFFLDQLAIDNLAEIMFPAVRADRNKIGAWRRIIPGA